MVILFWLSPALERGNPSLNHLMVGVGTPSAKQGKTATDRKANVWFDGPEIETQGKRNGALEKRTLALSVPRDQPDSSLDGDFMGK